MNGRMHRTRLLGLAALAAVGVLAIPASAHAARAHLVSAYKVEEHVDINGEDDTYTVACRDSSDIVLDGMWRIDNVDQDNDWDIPSHFPTGSPVYLAIQTSLRLIWVRPADSAGVYSSNKYTFKFNPTGGGDTQVKLWVTCLPNPSLGGGSGSHTNAWSAGTAATVTGQHLPGPTQTSYAALPLGTEVTARAQCPSGTVAIQPGFDITGDADLVMSFPGTPASVDLSRWQWTWYSPVTATIAHEAHCLSKVSGPASSDGHKHRLNLNFKQTTTSAAVPGLPAKLPKERQQACGELYKAILGAFDIRSSWDNANGWMSTWFLGMDPRIKSRAFKFVNLSSNPQSVTVGAVCVKDKTT